MKKILIAVIMMVMILFMYGTSFASTKIEAMSGIALTNSTIAEALASVKLDTMAEIPLRIRMGAPEFGPPPMQPPIRFADRRMPPHPDFRQIMFYPPLDR